MLQNILIRNIAIADNVDIDWTAGMTSISGETGAGKSILLNSLSLALGDRAESGIVRHGEQRAEVIATFTVSRIPAALKWLQERDLDHGDECILRRTVTREGRSRAFINGQPVPLIELKTLGEFLIDIHSQHAHQSLLRTDTHWRLLDEYAGLNNLKKQVKDAWVNWQGLERKFLQEKQQAEEKAARLQLLEYQCEELTSLAIEKGEVEELEYEYKRMHKSETLLGSAHKASEILDGEHEHSALNTLKSALNELKSLDDNSDKLKSAHELLESALIQAEEAYDDLSRYIESFNFDEERRFVVEQRLNAIHELGRKHNIQSESLFSHHQALIHELEELTESSSSIEAMEEEVSKRKQLYIKAAQKLSEKRKQKAKSFEKEIIEKLAQLAMPGAQFSVNIERAAKPTANGIDQVEFHICLNRGQALQPLAKVASGGELSRVSLAIQVICAEHTTIPTLVFDEVDVGISGATAEIVGHMLRSVGAKGQVICVTHLPQVAALGHNHCIVKKQHFNEHTTTNIVRLGAEQRVDEIARMLGGIDITAQTRAHAEEMLHSQNLVH